MVNNRLSALLSLIGVMLLWPYVLTKSVSSRLQVSDSTSLSAGQREERPHVVKRSTQSCDSSFDNYCLNKGQCMFLVDISEHHCKCEEGYYGPRCGNPELVIGDSMDEEHLIVTVVCVCMLIIALAAALYFFCKWYKKKQFPASAGVAGSHRRLDCLTCLPHKATAPAEKANQDFPVS